MPAIKHSDKEYNAKDGSTGSDAVPRLKRTGCYENSKLQDVSGNERVLPQSLDCGGCLEIHSLRLLEQPSVPTAQVGFLNRRSKFLYSAEVDISHP